MAPPIAPSPHRFLTSGASTAGRRKANEGSNISHDDAAVSQVTSRIEYRPKSSIQRGSQFAATPKFAPHNFAIAGQKTLSPVAGRDRVEDFEQQRSDANATYAVSPVLQRTTVHGTGEQIQDEVHSFNSRSSPYLVEHNELEEASPPSAKRRKLEPSSNWAASIIPHAPPMDGDAVIIESASHHLDPLELGVGDIRSLPPASHSTKGERYIGHPVFIEPVLPFSPPGGNRKAPRFEFNKPRDTFTRVTDASNGLQRVTGTNQFILPPTNATEDHDEILNLTTTNLALLFSPQKHKRYQYAPGGMAETVRDWVLGTASGVNGNAIVFRGRILKIESGERASRLALVADKLGEEHRCVLFGEPQGSSNVQVKVGSMLAIMEPAWLIESDKVWRVAVKWKLEQEDPGWHWPEEGR